MSELKFIADCVENYFGIDLKEKNRKEHYISCRMIYYQLCKELTAKTLKDIGEFVNRDHATVHHNLNKFEYDIITRPRDIHFKKGYIKLRAFIENNFKGFIDTEIAQPEVLTLEHYDDEKKQELFDLYNSLDDEGKDDLLFKARTLVKVRNKLKI